MRVIRFIRRVLNKLLALLPDTVPLDNIAPLPDVALPEIAPLPEPASSIDTSPIPEPVPSPDTTSLPVATHIKDDATTPPPLPTVACPDLMREAFRHFLGGTGLEIGALHNPLDISGLPISCIRYVDRMTEDELLTHYPELAGQPLVHVDVVDDGEVLATIPDASVDFIIGNHFLEHVRNPIGTMLNWLNKLAPNGILYLAIPDQRFTFDVNRALTSLEHIIADYKCDLAELKKRDHYHFWEWAAFVNQMPEDTAKARADYLEGMDYSIHFHTFRLQSFVGLLKYVDEELHAPFEIKAYADVLPGSNEFLVILARKASDGLTGEAPDVLAPGDA